MIKNERQYRITNAQAEKFLTTLRELARVVPPEGINARLWEAQRDGIKSQLKDLVKELREYEALKSGRQKIIELDSLEQLPKALIQARIAAGLTQQDLASRLSLKPQQIQRWEANDYQAASFARIRQIAQVLRSHL